ncbi:hypothetical protein FKW77_009305 [Venturia effusa]|uniref:FAD/NAD(P)-binding domain-containing protein n=1 Tax=Venturia effusa TaxID=50376 RepID=A0A517L025_9PEZI|nr:hypothetical protein FKW77_009305 [Venturia effusa]
MSRREPLNIVILGGSFAGISVAQAFLRQTYDELSRQYELKTKTTPPNFRVILVSPSTHFFWNIAAPRALVSPESAPYSKYFIPILENFEGCPKGRFTFIQGTASALDPNARKVEITLCGEDLAYLLHNQSLRADSGTGRETWEGNANPTKTITKKISYHALIIATGTSAESPLLSLHGEHKKTIEAFGSFHAKMSDAASIIVAGGGTSGVECAGQLASYLGGKQDERAARLCFKRRKSSPMVFARLDSSPNNKIVTLISGNNRLLPEMSLRASELAETQLRKLGVNIMHNTRLVTAQNLPSGQTRCVLSDDLSISCDLFVACTGVYPNTSWMPREFLDTDGYIQTNPETLRVSAGGDRVYAIGDCTAFSRKRLDDIYDCLPVLMSNLRNDLMAHGIRAQRHRFKDIGYFLAQLVDAKYVQKKVLSTFIPVTRWGGVGLIAEHKIPSWLVWAIKGRDFGTEKGAQAAAMGYNPFSSESYFKNGR